MFAGYTAQPQQQHPLQRCLAVVDHVLQHQDAFPFAEPVRCVSHTINHTSHTQAVPQVDPNKVEGCDNYYEVIKDPMDLGTIRYATHTLLLLAHVLHVHDSLHSYHSLLFYAWRVQCASAFEHGRGLGTWAVQHPRGGVERLAAHLEQLPHLQRRRLVNQVCACTHSTWWLNLLR